MAHMIFRSILGLSLVLLSITPQVNAAELLIKKGSVGTYEDGDILVAVNDARIAEVYKQMGLPNTGSYPWTEYEKKNFIILKVDDFVTAKVAEYTSASYDVDGNLIQKRTKKIDCLKNLGLSTEEKRNLDTNPDLRSKGTYDPKTIITVKP